MKKRRRKKGSYRKRRKFLLKKREEDLKETRVIHLLGGGEIRFDRYLRPRWNTLRRVFKLERNRRQNHEKM